MKKYKVNGDVYQYICTVNEDIIKLSAQMKDISAQINKLGKIALEMGQRMERHLIDRADKITVLKEKYER